MIPSIFPPRDRHSVIPPSIEHHGTDHRICIELRTSEKISLCACAFFMGVVVGLGLVGAL